MALWQSSSRLVWKGLPTIRRVEANLRSRKRTVLRLPIAYHPALSASLYDGTPTRRRIDVIGDARLLACIARVDGLGELEQLVESMQTAAARLRICSPAPHLVFNVAPATRRS